MAGGTTQLDALLDRGRQITKDAADTAQSLAGAGGLQHFAGGLQFSQAIQTTIATAKGFNGGFNSFGQFIKCVRAVAQPESAGDEAPRYKSMMEHWKSDFQARVKTNSPLGMNESFSASDGGALVPPEFVAQILMRMYANDILSRCTVFPMGSNSLKIPAINETSRADGSRFGGVLSYWRKEAGSVTATKPGLMTVDLSLESLMIIMRVTQELLEDTGGALEVFLSTIAAQEIQFRLGDAIVNGDGNGKPLGIMRAACRVTQAAESSGNSAAAGTGLVTANVLKMWSRLHVSCRPTAVWLYDQSIEPNLFTLTIGTAGAQLAVYQPPGGVSAQPFGTLLGRPMIATEFCQPVGTEGDIILADLTQYLVGTRGGVQTAVSMHLYFDTNELAYRFTIRMDGRPWWLLPLTPKSGGPTQGCFVTVADRA